jgi:hypothetical protein
MHYKDSKLLATGTAVTAVTPGKDIQQGDKQGLREDPSIGTTCKQAQDAAEHITLTSLQILPTLPEFLYDYDMDHNTGEKECLQHIRADCCIVQDVGYQSDRMDGSYGAKDDEEILRICDILQQVDPFLLTLTDETKACNEDAKVHTREYDEGMDLVLEKQEVDVEVGAKEEGQEQNQGADEDEYHSSMECDETRDIAHGDHYGSREVGAWSSFEFDGSDDDPDNGRPCFEGVDSTAALVTSPLSSGAALELKLKLLTMYGQAVKGLSHALPASCRDHVRDLALCFPGVAAQVLCMYGSWEASGLDKVYR